MASFCRIEYASSPVGRKIYDSSHTEDGGIVDPDDVGKYEVNTPHDLTIHALEVTDGGFYGCAWGSDVHRADVIVIGK